MQSNLNTSNRVYRVSTISLKDTGCAKRNFPQSCFMSPTTAHCSVRGEPNRLALTHRQTVSSPPLLSNPQQTQEGFPIRMQMMCWITCDELGYLLWNGRRVKLAERGIM